ncbi:SLC25A29 [Bugula neritina]|uniref:SLC25A29 n=1 Tax=Bugula neritina TaxID=10212 RepID=A0A7J7KTR8_BUGNE|nr:SLC25A29 [Bugula neritina]
MYPNVDTYMTSSQVTNQRITFRHLQVLQVSPENLSPSFFIMSLVDFAAGCLGGVANVVVGHPFDTVKVRFQQSNSTHRRTLRCFTSIVQQETVRGLYKGVTSPLYSLAAINAILFGVQGNMLRKMHDPNALSSHFAAGVMAGFLQCGISCPMELAKIKLQVQGEGLKYGSLKNADYTGSIDCLTKVYNLEGLRGVCRGQF